ncbi:MAG: ABC transporter ATP-binding protein [Proteobacteria bacterium]|nr:MAG: ABC transporter ATP-binding protein [Pseudomonadota bacterium]
MKIDQLSLVIEGKRLLDQVSFEIPQSSLFIILGPNGAGKTLLLRCLAGFQEPSTGRIIREVEDLAWVPLSQPLPFGFQVSDVLLMGRYRQHQGFPGSRDRERIAETAKRLDITHLLARQYNSLSRGEQTKVDITRAVASESMLILLDEPFSNLDIDASLQMIDLFKDLQRSGKTLILSHHDLYSVKDLATHGLLMKKGQVVTHGPIDEVFQPSWIQEAYNVKPVFGGEGSLRFEKRGL